MQKRHGNFQDEAGNAIPQATIFVYFSNSSALATIFTDNQGTIKSNPFISDSLGQWEFFAPDGVYDLKCVKQGFESKELDNLQFLDGPAVKTALAELSGTTYTYIQDAEPTATIAGEWWLQTSTGIVFRSIAPGTSWIEMYRTVLNGMSGSVSLNGNLSLDSTSSAFILPRLTTVQRDTLIPAEGWLIFNKDEQKPQVFAVGVWGALGGGSGGTQPRRTEAHFAELIEYGTTDTRIPKAEVTHITSNDFVCVIINTVENGIRVTANMDCEVSMVYCDQFMDQMDFGISKNAANPSADFTSESSVQRVAIDHTSGPNAVGCAVFKGSLAAGDILRPHTDMVDHGSYITLSSVYIYAVEIIS